MARILYIENPEQSGRCLSSDLAAYINTIPPRFDSVTALVAAINAAPFLVDEGESALSVAMEGQCSPGQRSRIWPQNFNCWEATAHFAAEASRLLPADWTIVIQDKTLNERRHVWPVITFGNKLAPITEIQPKQPANEWYNDLFGGVHFVGDKVLRVFGLGTISDQISNLAGDSLPDWARTDDQRAKQQQSVTPEPAPPATAPTVIAPPANPTATNTASPPTTSQTSVTVQVPTSSQGNLSDSMKQAI